MFCVSDGMKKVYIIKSSVNKLCDGMKDTSSSRIKVNIFERGTINTWFCFGFNTVENVRLSEVNDTKDTRTGTRR